MVLVLSLVGMGERGEFRPREAAGNEDRQIGGGLDVLRIWTGKDGFDRRPPASDGCAWCTSLQGSHQVEGRPSPPFKGGLGDREERVLSFQRVDIDLPTWTPKLEFVLRSGHECLGKWSETEALCAHPKGIPERPCRCYGVWQDLSPPSTRGESFLREPISPVIFRRRCSAAGPRIEPELVSWPWGRESARGHCTGMSTLAETTKPDR